MISRAILKREKKLRNKAFNVGYRLTKGFRRYMYNNAIYRDDCNNTYTGYMVEDLSSGYYVWGCYDNNYTHLWTLDEAESFIKGIYADNNMNY